jgi:hypothetical protein
MESEHQAMQHLPNLVEFRISPSDDFFAIRLGKFFFARSAFKRLTAAMVVQCSTTFSLLNTSLPS